MQLLQAAAPTPSYPDLLATFHFVVTKPNPTPTEKKGKTNREAEPCWFVDSSQLAIDRSPIRF
jgi:hypothetical protein